MKNVLSDKQKHQLNIWVEGVGPNQFDTYTVACDTASRCLGFIVTYSNMKSSEKATGVSLVKAPAPKKIDLESRIVTLENSHRELLESFQQYCRVPIPESLCNSFIKPAQPKPVICHKHG